MGGGGRSHILMKKWTILTIAVLAAILLVMQYIIEKKKVAVIDRGQQADSAEPQLGVALPSGATAYAGAAGDNYVPAYSGGASYGAISLPTIQSSYKGACAAASLLDMLATHDKYWGYLARSAAFSPSETQKMYDLLADYTACHAAARTDVSVCDALPATVNQEGVKVDPKVVPNAVCRKKAITLFSEAYLAGNISGDSYCRLELSYWPREDLDKISIPEYCAAAATGPGPAADYLRKTFPEAGDAVLKDLPAKESDCKKDPECLERLDIYNAVKKARPGACPKAYEPLCQALANRSSSPCESVLKDMSKHYCASVERVKKLSGGYIGLSKEEAKVELDKLKAQRAEADEMKKQQQKVMEEVNKQVRETLKKK